MSCYTAGLRGRDGDTGEVWKGLRVSCRGPEGRDPRGGPALHRCVETGRDEDSQRV